MHWLGFLGMARNVMYPCLIPPTEQKRHVWDEVCLSGRRQGCLKGSERCERRGIWAWERQKRASHAGCQHLVASTQLPLNAISGVAESVCRITDYGSEGLYTTIRSAGFSGQIRRHSVARQDLIHLAQTYSRAVCHRDWISQLPFIIGALCLTEVSAVFRGHNPGLAKTRVREKNNPRSTQRHK